MSLSHGPSVSIIENVTLSNTAIVKLLTTISIKHLKIHIENYKHPITTAFQKLTSNLN